MSELKKLYKELGAATTRITEQREALKKENEQYWLTPEGSELNGQERALSGAYMLLNPSRIQRKGVGPWRKAAYEKVSMQLSWEAEQKPIYNDPYGIEAPRFYGFTQSVSAVLSAIQGDHTKLQAIGRSVEEEDQEQNKPRQRQRGKDQERE